MGRSGSFRVRAGVKTSLVTGNENEIVLMSSLINIVATLELNISETRPDSEIVSMYSQ